MPTGNLVVDRVTRGVVRTRLVGHALAEHVAPIREAVEAEIACGFRPLVFHDWERMTGYESSARIEMTRWYDSVRDRVTAVHVLTANRLVAMGVQVVAMAVGARIQIHRSRASFERELAAARQRAAG